MDDDNVVLHCSARSCEACVLPRRFAFPERFALAGLVLVPWRASATSRTVPAALPTGWPMTGRLIDLLTSQAIFGCDAHIFIEQP
jgi:hypothetical protein